MDRKSGKTVYELMLTNREVRLMFESMIEDWFLESVPAYNDFIRAMICDDVKQMNLYMNEVAFQTFSFFDSGNIPSKTEPERFYHGFVLGLIVDLSERYQITSNRESGFGRYDVMLESRNREDKAYILEFKVHDPDAGEKTLEDTAQDALRQIEVKGYAADLTAKGFLETHGRKLFLLFLKPIINGSGNYYIEAQTRDSRRTDVIVDYHGEQFIIELKIWRGNEYREQGERQFIEYLDYYHQEKGYLLSFNFNKKKETGIRKIQIDGKTIMEVVV